MEQIQRSNETKEKMESALDRLRNFSVIGFQGEVITILVVKGIKPVGEFSWAAEIKSDEQKKSLEKSIEEVKGALADLGLFFDCSVYPWDEYTRVDCHFSLDPKVLLDYQRLIKDESLSIEESNERVAKFFGYPETAIEAWGKGEDFLIEDLSEIKFDPKDQDLKKFILALELFRLSKDHWHEELEFYRKCAEVVKQTDPVLWKQIQTDF